MTDRESINLHPSPAKLNYCKGKLITMKLEKGKRYSFPIAIPSDGRVKSGLFTGEYDKNGNAVLITKDGSVWNIPPENCVKS